MKKKLETTIALLKPEAFEDGAYLKIMEIIEENGFKIENIVYKALSKEEAEEFYFCHKGKSFFNSLTDHMCSGKIIALKLEKENAVKSWRELMGATDPSEAAEGTIRKLFATAINRNMVHGSDSIENAIIETKFFFGK